MVTEVLVAIIAAFSAIMVAAIQYRNSKSENKTKTDIKAMKHDPNLSALKDAKERAYDSKEDANDNLTLTLANFQLDIANLSDVESARNEYVQSLQKYRDVKDRYLHKMEQWIDNS